jgi:predicted ATPase/transcriptional regulator with XRE-family HTH domain
MPRSDSSISMDSFATFGDLLKYLRRRARRTQREVAIAVGYSEAQISRLEQNQRPPDLATLTALFIPALYLEDEPEIVTRLMELAAQARGEELPHNGVITFSRSVQHENVQTVEVDTLNNLPLQLTSFVGREHEIAEIKNLFGKARLITLTGSGGSGKTRLALETARQLVESYQDGIWLIELASITDPNLVLQTVASTLGIPESHNALPTLALTKYLRTKQILLILDNCEQIVTVTARLAEEILRTCPQVQILVTSREILNLTGEVQFRVPTLSLSKEKSLNRDMFSPSEAVQLFVDRAQAVLPSFVLTENVLPAVTKICHLVDGLPLGIELAAAKITVLSVEQIATRLNHSLQMLSGGRVNIPHHQTLEATIQWSYDLLSEAERTLLQRLSVFSGGWTLEAAESVVSDSSLVSTENVFDLISQLVNKSLIVVEWQLSAEARYTMLETIREYARGQLHEAGEVAKLQKRHFDYFLDFAERARVIGPQKSIWLNRLEAEQDNFRAALVWSWESQSAEQLDQATYLLGLLTDYSFYRGYATETLEWFDKFLSFDLPPTRGRGLAFQKAGFLTRVRGDFDQAVRLLDRGLAISREIGDNERAGWALLDLANAARDMGNTEEVIPGFSKALSLFQELGDTRGTLCSYYQLATTYVQRHDLTKAQFFWEQGLELSRQMNDKSFIAWGLEGLAGTAFLESQAGQARMLHTESLKSKLEVMDKVGIAHSFEGLAQAVALEEKFEHAAVLWGAAEQLRTLLNMPLDPSREDVYTSLIPTTREQIGDELFDEAWKKGKGMTLNEAIEFALTLPKD